MKNWMGRLWRRRTDGRGPETRAEAFRSVSLAEDVSPLGAVRDHFVPLPNDTPFFMLHKIVSYAFLKRNPFLYMDLPGMPYRRRPDGLTEV